MDRRSFLTGLVATAAAAPVAARFTSALTVTGVDYGAGGDTMSIATLVRAKAIARAYKIRPIMRGGQEYYVLCRRDFAQTWHFSASRWAPAPPEPA